MKVYVVIATKGRPKEVYALIRHLGEQLRRPDCVLVVGANETDLPGEWPAVAAKLSLITIVAPRPGLTVQRNIALDSISREYVTATDKSPFIVVFFDDDFRPATDWLLECEKAFGSYPKLAGATGQILADGINGPGISEEKSQEFLAGLAQPIAHWASGEFSRNIECAYGCNMAFRDTVVQACRFDENLPLYGWQEDQDFSSRALQFGEIRYLPQCRGVHMGVKSGRQSGVKFGYSQIANAIYLVKKGTMSRTKAGRFIRNHLISNHLRSIYSGRNIDYRGRLLGNWLAIADLLRSRIHPERILEL